MEPKILSLSHSFSLSFSRARTHTPTTVYSQRRYLRIANLRAYKPSLSSDQSPAVLSLSLSHTHALTNTPMEPTNEDAGWLKVMEVATLSCLPLALRAALQLGVIDILAKHGGERCLSTREIVSHFEAGALASTTSVEEASASLDRILRVLACHGLLSSSLITRPDELSIRTYGLNSCSRLLGQQKEGQWSLAPYALFQLDPLIVRPFFHLQEAIADGTTPFSKAHDIACWPFLERNPRLNELFNQAMASHSKSILLALLERYHGFNDITSLVDVGGGNGACLHMITSKYPHIKGINFDQPHVIANAPQYSGVKHVGGDMFEKIPQASAIFMKGILHDWSDAECSKLLTNCYQSLPKKGKVIIVNPILPTQVECELDSRVKYHMDLLMFANTQGGRERTQNELDVICKASGFSRIQVICNIYGTSVVEMYKEPSENGVIG